MGGLEVHNANGSVPVVISRIITLTCASLTIPVPSVKEQIRILKMFGRPKDVERASLLEALSGSETC